jgi:fluoroquinolone transport system ATP-binding protein
VNARRVKDIVRDLREQGRTVFLTTHDMATADELCDRVAFVVDGRIAALDSPRELRIAQSRRQVRVEYRDDAGALVGQDFPLDDLVGNPGFHEVLRTRRVETLHSQESTLDDVFVRATGQELR